MIEFIWPWLLLLMPLPLLAQLRRGTDAGPATGPALQVPFCDQWQALSGKQEGSLPAGSHLWRWLLWSLLVLAVSRPVWVGEETPRIASGRDLMLLMDVSGSMRQVDFAQEGEHLTHLDLVKQSAHRFVEKRTGDRLGLILFGDRPHLRAPPTWDHAVLHELIDEARVALAGESTAIGDAIGLAIRHLKELPARSRVLVLITDGANNEGLLRPRQAARLAKRFGIRIYTIGIGRPQGPAPNPWGVWSTEGAERFEQAVLEEIARITGGRFLHALDAGALKQAFDTIDLLEPAPDQAARLHLARPLFPWLLGAALLMALARRLRWS